MLLFHIPHEYTLVSKQDIMFNKAIAFALIGLSTFTAVNMTSVTVGPEGNLTLITGEQKAEARRKPRFKPKPTTGAKNVLKRILKGMDGESILVEGLKFFKSDKGDDIFIVDNEFRNEWNEVAVMCDRRNGKLIWRNDLKTCIPR